MKTPIITMNNFKIHRRREGMTNTTFDLTFSIHGLRKKSSATQNSVVCN